MSTTIITPSSPVAPVVMSSTQEPSAEGELIVVTPSPPSTASVSVLMPQVSMAQESTVVTKLAVAEASVVPPAAEEPASSDDLAKLYASLHEEGGSSALVAPLDEDSKAAIERLRDFCIWGSTK
ncbi:hypothetical protein Pyn_32244 [Prunus yedoensis var. nudiflora]|uniref:Uncharacterized protein n=1 Tax=Prunus yedoensis var. nudiflora TaxID=2094558 RepID=A0A314ZH51_PRUYE|nr:hypothetical protein Pyn_32244 [Prunus yedoensis var. nudiflora]